MGLPKDGEKPPVNSKVVCAHFTHTTLRYINPSQIFSHETDHPCMFTRLYRYKVYLLLLRCAAY